MTKLTSRDRKILRTIASCQVLDTSQVHRWHFGNVSLNMAQKRLRKLDEGGHLDAIETNACTDNRLILGKEGPRQLQQAGWNVEIKTELPNDLAHNVGVVAIRIDNRPWLEH